MNYLHHPNLLVHFWAAVHTELDRLLDKFVRGNGWLYHDLCRVAEESNVGSLYRCAVTTINRPEQSRFERTDHFQRVIFVIMDAAKTQWLVPWRKYVVDPSSGAIPSFLKRQIGGFFLMYMMYSAQPTPHRYFSKLKIPMDYRDILAMHVYITSIKLLPKTDVQFKELKRQFVATYNDLVLSGAFEFTLYCDDFSTMNLSVQNLLENKLSILTKHLYGLKDLRDQLYYITHNDSLKVFESMVNYGKLLNKEKSRIEQDEEVGPSKEKFQSTKIGKSKVDRTKFRISKKPWPIAEINALTEENDIGIIAHNVPSILNTMDFGPIFNQTRMTGISPKILNQELTHCKKVYDTQSKLENVETTRNKNQNVYRPSVNRNEGKMKNIGLVAWKHYLQAEGNHDWVDELFKSGLVETQQRHEHIEQEINHIEYMKVDESDDNDSVEWETDEENESEDETTESPCKIFKNDSSTEFFSMPTLNLN